MGIKSDALLLFAVGLSINLALVYSFSGGNHFVDDDTWYYLGLVKNLDSGRGYTTDFVWPLNDGMQPIPMRSYIAQPVYPLLVLLAYWIMGHSLPVAFLVNASIEAANAALVYLIAVKISGSRPLGFFSWALYATNYYVMWTVVNMLTESVYSLFALMAFLLLLDGRSVRNTFLMGLAVGAAYMCRYHAALLLAVIAWQVLRQTGKAGRRHLLVLLAAAVLAASPLLIRNVLETGDPLHTPQRYYLLMPDMRDVIVYTKELGTPSLWDYASRINAKNLAHSITNAIVLVFLFFYPHISWLTFVMLILAGYALIKGLWQDTPQSAFYAYAAITLIGDSTTIGYVRYMYSCIPLMLLAAAAAAEKIRQDHKIPAKIAAAAVIILICLSTFDSMKSLVEFKARPLREVNVSRWLSGRVGPDDVVMASYPAASTYVLGVRGVAVPSQKAELKKVIDHYGVRYVIYDLLYDPSADGTPTVTGEEPYLKLLHIDEKDGFKVYEVAR